MTAPVLASSASFADTSNATSRNIGKPSGTASGDWLFLAVSIDAAATIGTPSGFTSVFNQQEPGGSMSLAVFKRKADGTEGGTFTVATSSEIANGIIIRVTGADSTEALDAMSVWGGSLNAIRSSGVIPTLDAYAACSDGSLVLQVAALDDGAASFSATPSGHTSVATVGASSSGTSMSMHSKTMASQGYVGPSSWTFSDDTEDGWAVTLVIRASANTSYPAQPVIRCMNALHQPSGTAASILKPYGTVDAETLLLVQTGKSASTLTPPAGFTSIQDTSNGTDVYHQAYYKLASGEGGSYSVALSTASGPICTLMRIVGASTSSPIDASSVATGTDTSPTASTITPTADNCLILYTEGNDDDEVVTDSGYPAGYSGVYAESNDDGTDCGMILARKEQTTAAATGSAAGSFTATEQWVAFHIAVKPAGGATDVTANPTGVSAAGTVGTPIATGTASVAPTGLSATGSAGTPAVRVSQSIGLTGLSATGSPGSPAVTGTASVTPAGVQATGNVGTPAASVSESTALAGLEAAGSVGAIAATGTSTHALTGLQAAGGIGTPTATGGATTELTGLASTGTPGIPTAAGGASTPLTGLEATGATGTVAATGGANAEPAGQEATGTVGSPAITGTATTELTGLTATGSVGTATAEGGAGGDADAEPSGLAATGAVGTPAATGGANSELSGQQAAGAAGTPAATGGALALPSGNESTGSAGTPTVTGTAESSLTGLTAAGETGTPAITGGAAILLGGQSAAGEIGTPAIATDIEALLSGQSATGAVGTPNVINSAQAILDGLQSDTALGSPSLSGTAVLSLTGFVIEASGGTVSVVALLASGLNVVTVARQDRIVTVSAEARVVTPAARNRTTAAQARSRTVTVANDFRIIQVSAA